MNMQKELKTIPFDVVIPNLDGDGVAATITIQVSAYTDPQSGEEILTPEAMDLIEKTQARHMGLMLADEIKALRERLDLTQEEMSDLLQIGAKSYTRWESGRSRPSRSMNVLLCAMRDGQLDINYLRSLRDPGSENVWASHWTEISQPHWSDWLKRVKPDATARVYFVHDYVIPTETEAARTQGTARTNCDCKWHTMHARSLWGGTFPQTPRLPSERQQRENFLNAAESPDTNELPA